MWKVESGIIIRKERLLPHFRGYFTVAWGGLSAKSDFGLWQFCFELAGCCKKQKTHLSGKGFPPV